jgi:hypothetical protein
VASFMPNDSGAGRIRSEPVTIVKMTARPGHRHDVVRLIVELGQAPEEQERWWWAELVGADNSPVMHSYRNGLLNVQFDTPREELEERARPGGPRPSDGRATLALQGPARRWSHDWRNGGPMPWRKSPRGGPMSVAGARDGLPFLGG